MEPSVRTAATARGTEGWGAHRSGRLERHQAHCLDTQGPHSLKQNGSEQLEINTVILPMKKLQIFSSLVSPSCSHPIQGFVPISLSTVAVRP